VSTVPPRKGSPCTGCFRGVCCRQFGTQGDEVSNCGQRSRDCRYRLRGSKRQNDDALVRSVSLELTFSCPVVTMNQLSSPTPQRGPSMTDSS
jgi:hypothetical protein